MKYDPDARSLTYAGRAGRKSTAALEDLRVSVSDNILYKSASYVIDTLSDDIEVLSSFESIQESQQEGP